MSPASRRAASNDLRNQPAYPLSEAARYLKLPPATLRSWVLGRQYDTSAGARHFPALVAPASRHPPVLSFTNLIEAHVLRALRTDHGISVKDVRKAVAYAEGELGIDRIFLSQELAAGAGKLFLDRYGELIELSASGQIAMRQILAVHLERIEWDEWKFPVRLYPFLATDGGSWERPIAIDPTIAFGRPVIIKRGIATVTIAERIDAGETVDAVAADYDLTADDIEQAILYERGLGPGFSTDRGRPFTVA